MNAIGFAARVVGSTILIGATAPRSGFALKANLVVYGGALLAMLGCSAPYRANKGSPRKDLLRRLDHAAIFGIIAGAYTSFLMVKLEGSWSC